MKTCIIVDTIPYCEIGVGDVFDMCNYIIKLAHKYSDLKVGYVKADDIKHDDVCVVDVMFLYVGPDDYLIEVANKWIKKHW